MNPFLRAIGQTLAVAGECARTVWRYARRKAAALRRLARMKAKRGATATRQTLTAFWEKHHQTVVWIGLWLAFGTLATAGLLYVYHTNPQANLWLSNLGQSLLALLLTPFDWLAQQRRHQAEVRHQPSPPVMTAVHTAPVTPLPQPPPPPKARPIPGLPSANTQS
jgi:hypothetical protein